MITINKLNEMSKKVYAHKVNKGDLVKTVWGYAEVTDVEVKTWETTTFTGRKTTACETTIYLNGKLNKMVCPLTEAVIVVRAEDLVAEAVASADENVATNEEIVTVSEIMAKPEKVAVEFATELSIVNDVNNVNDLVAPVEILKATDVLDGRIITAVTTFEDSIIAEKIATYKIHTCGNIDVLSEYKTKIEAVVIHDQHVKDPIDNIKSIDPIIEAVALQMKFLNININIVMAEDLIIKGYTNSKTIKIYKANDPIDGSDVFKIITQPTGSTNDFKYKEVYYNSMAEILEALKSTYGIISNL